MVYKHETFTTYIPFDYEHFGVFYVQIEEQIGTKSRKVKFSQINFFLLQSDS